MDKPRINFEALQPEFFANEPTWLEFMEALADTIQDHVRDPIGEIEDLRHIVEDTDPEVIARTIKQLGFDIPTDLIRHNSKQLAKSVYMLALFHEKSGTDDFVKGVRFVLGRDVWLTNLYTNDYENFYPSPGGPLLADGGDWYLTTHVDLSMELIPSDANVVLPVGKTLSDRLMDAYYEFAPINHVVREFYFLLNVYGEVGIAGKIQFHDIDYITIGLGGEILHSINSLLPYTVDAGSTLRILSDLTYYSDSCVALSNPRLGYADAGLSDGSNILAMLPNSLPNTKNQNILVSDTSGKFAYLAYPVELGRATIIDPVSGVAGGWDGAGWPASGITGTSSGPVVVKVEQDGEMRDWYLYRTDVSITSARAFYVEFENPGIVNSCDLNESFNTPTPEPIIELPVEEDNDEKEPCATLTPVYGAYDLGLNSSFELEFLEHGSERTTDQRFTLTVPDNQYGYFAYPVEMGYAEFTDVATGIEGGWDGADWASSEPENSAGPIVVVRSICGAASEWYVYRTDMPGIGERTFDVTFGNPVTEVPVYEPEEPVEEEDPCVSGYPTFLISSINAVFPDELDGPEAFVLDSTEDLSMDINLEAGEYGYFAHPIELGTAIMRNVSTGNTELWNGAGWPDTGAKGDTTGPIVIQRRIGGKLHDWYLYRTNFPSLGEFTVAVTFPSAGLCVNTEIAPPPTEEEPEEPPHPLLSAQCIVDAYPRYGSLRTAHGISPSHLEQGLPSTGSPQTFTVTIAAGEYGYFAYPAALGLATFIDPDTNLVGGWDGASWPEDGSIGESTGPVLIANTTSNGEVSRWYLYRTDWPSLGEVTFNVGFTKPGLEIGYILDECDTSETPIFSELESPAPSTASVSTTASTGCLVSGYPRFGTGNKLSTQAHIAALANSASVTDNHTLSLTVPDGEYGWYAHPAALGHARFVDQRAGVSGGWDGATWPEGSVEMSEGPVLVNVSHLGESVPWLLYRTDFPSIGAATYSVYFDNTGLTVGSRIPCSTLGVPAPLSFGGSLGTTHNMPVYGATASPVENNTDLNAYITASLPNTRNQAFSLSVSAGEYGYFAYPAFLGFARIRSRSGDIRWGSEANEHPTYVYRRVAGELQVWFLYRTRLPGVGSHTYDVTFGADAASVPSGRRTVRTATPVLATDRPDIVSFDSNGVAQFAPVYRDTTVHITTTFQGRTDTKAILVRARGAILDYIRITGPSQIKGGDTFSVDVEGYYADGHVRALDDAAIRILSPYIVRRVGYTFKTGNPPEDDVLHVEAIYVDRDGNKHSDVLPVILNSVDPDVTVDALYIIGPDQMTEKTEHQFRAHAFFTDGSQQDVLALWESSSPGLFVDQSGLAIAGAPQANFQATLKVTYQHRGQKYTANKVIEIARSYITAKSLRIDGPDRVIELSKTAFLGYITWSNGAVTRVSPEWTSNRFSIDADGVLATGSVSNSLSVELTARTLGLAATKVVSVYETPVEIEHLTIVGPENLHQGVTSQYRAFARYSDGRDVEVFPTWSIVGNRNFSVMTPSGELTFSGSSSGIIEISASYDNGVRIYSQTKPIVLIPNVSLISGLVIHGPSEVLEGKRINLTATAIYEDGTTEIVEPLWSARSPDPLNEPEPAVDTVSPGIVQGRSVDEDTVAIIEARYFREIAEYPIIVKHYDRPGPVVPLSARITGPQVLPVSQTGSYVLWVELDNDCNQEIAMSNDWTIDVENDVAVIDQNGFLRSINGEDTTVTLTAEWACDGNTITRQYTVRLLAEETTLSSLHIRGPESVLVNSFVPYSVELFRVGQPVVEGTGETPDVRDVAWSIETIIPNVTISDEGTLYAGDVLDGTRVVLKATYTEGLHTISATQSVVIRTSEGPEAPPVVSNLPMYGLGPVGVKDFETFETYATHTMTTSTTETFTVEAGGSDYVYYAHPKSLGMAAFTETVLNLSGGMEGATWPDDGSVGADYGPLTVARTLPDGTTQEWYLYRSDFPGIGAVEFRVEYTPE